MRGCLPIILAGRISSHYMWTTPDVLWLFCETWVTSAWSSCQYFSNLLYKKLPNLYNSSMQIELTSVSLIRMELLSSSSDFINIYITFHQAASQGCPASIISYILKLSSWNWKSFSTVSDGTQNVKRYRYFFSSNKYFLDTDTGTFFVFQKWFRDFFRYQIFPILPEKMKNSWYWYLYRYLYIINLKNFGN